jgi:asparagine synthetase B (glutamine-hydrolysing)
MRAAAGPARKDSPKGLWRIRGEAPAARAAPNRVDDVTGDALVFKPRDLWLPFIRRRIARHRRMLRDRSDTEVLCASVRRQLVADVPVGVFLSGGVDPGLITALAAEATPDLTAFTARVAARGRRREL